MSTLSVPPVPTSPRDDTIALYRAFKGTSPSLSLSLKILYKHVFTTCLVQRWKSSTKKYEFHNTYRLLHSREPFISFLSIIFGSKWLFLLFGFLFYWFHCMSYHMCHLMSPSTNLPKNFHLIEIWKLFLILFGGHSFFHIGALIFFDKTNCFYLLVNIYGLINIFTRNKYLYWLKFGGLKRLPHLP